MFRLSARRVFSLAQSRVSAQPVRAFGSAFWAHVPQGPKDPILGVTEAFNADPFEGKISVGVGAYRTDEGKPWVLPSVKEAESRVVDANLNMEYAPISGVPAFVEHARALAYGPESDAVVNKRVAALQSLSGTGALRLAAAFFAAFPGSKGPPTIMVPNPTWGNHFPIFEHAGLKVQQYRYYDPNTLGLDLDGMLEDIRNVEGDVVVLLHACAHNPTGVDPTTEQWKVISEELKKQHRFVLFDNAYQGFASGDTDKDVAAVRMFAESGHNIALCQSFAKNFGLYGQRVGMFSILNENQDEATRVESQLKILARAMYSSPPLHGARIVAEVLGDPQLKTQWQSEIKLMADRIISMRFALVDELKKAGSTKNWDHITNQIGMFSYTGMTPEQCDKITGDHHVYLTKNGRISMAGVTTANVGPLAQAIHAVTK